jgi:hypothetical protein
VIFYPVNGPDVTYKPIRFHQWRFSGVLEQGMRWICFGLLNVLPTLGLISALGAE